MDLKSNYFIFLTPWPGLRQDQVLVELAEKYNAEIPEKINQEIERAWNEKKKGNARIYAQTKFRLGSICINDQNKSLYEEAKIGKVDRLKLGIGVTDYKQFIGTNCNPKVIEIIEAENNRNYLSEIIGVNGVLITSDGFLLITRRAAWVGEHPNMLDTPGGHPEPSNLDKNFDLKSNLKVPSVTQLDEKAVTREIFESQRDEISVEFNIPREKISDPKLLSIGRVSSGNGRPVIYFNLSTTLSKSEIEASWQKGGQETDEATALTFIHQSQIKNLPSSEIWEEISPNGHLSILSLIRSKNL